MLKVFIIAVGKIKDNWIIKGIEEFAKRLGGYCQFSIIEINEGRLPNNPSQGEISLVLEKEGEDILSKIPPRSRVVPLCIEGKQYTSEQLAGFIADTSLDASNLVFVIGSSHGLSNKVKQAGNAKLSLSKMTFPHQLTRLILCEQIYRGFSINAGSKYHK